VASGSVESRSSLEAQLLVNLRFFPAIVSAQGSVGLIANAVLHISHAISVSGKLAVVVVMDIWYDDSHHRLPLVPPSLILYICKKSKVI
jgi:hypothetical protein